MRRLTSLITTLAVMWATIAGCSSSGHATAATWANVSATLGGPVDSQSANVCDRGDAACIPIVADEMRRRERPLLASCSHRAAFGLMYLRVTEGVQTNPVNFTDPHGVDHLDAIFANLFFTATDNYGAGQTAQVPMAWQTAFRAADDRSVTGLGDLLLGMNAHISRDLPFALLTSGTVTAPSEQADFTRVNQVLIDAQGPIVKEVGARLDPLVSIVAGTALGFSGQTISATIAAWRAEAWRNAQRLAAAPAGPQRDAVAASIDAAAQARADIIVAADHYPPLLPGTIIRDGYCAQHHGTLSPPG